jgi:hypothetical protein
VPLYSTQILRQLTVLLRAHLDERRAGSLASVGLGGDADVVHGVGGEVLQQVRALRRHDRNPHVLPELAVIVVQLETLDRVARVLGRVPRKLDGVRRQRLSLQIGRLLRYCITQGNKSSTLEEK